MVGIQMKLLLLVAVSSCLSGCALTLEMMAISGISYLATGKSLSDNAFSAVTNRDCALHRIIMNQAVCVESVENEQVPANTNDEFMLARNKTADTDETELATAQNINSPAEDLAAGLPSDVVAGFDTVSMSNFAVLIDEPKVKSTEYSSAQTFAVVGSFNNYQYAQRRNEKYLSFNPQIIKNHVDSATKYRVVVGPVKRHDFIAELPVMVGAETQLPWEIDLCVNDMSPPPCNNTYAVNTPEQQSANWIEAAVVSETLVLR
jgi:hypothetical protein